jgi:transposase
MLRGMAYLIKKKTKYSTYYVVAESKRIDGKPRVVNQWYLGTIEKLIELAEGNPSREDPREISCQEHGSVSALLDIAKELGIVEIVNSHVKKRKQGLSVGDYILVAALNRAIAASSKAQIAEWVEETTLPLLLDIDTSKLSSQNFWDHFDKIDQDSVEKIGDSLARRAIELESINLDCLVYDTTNYYNYWDVTTESELARMTKSKAGKHHLKHIGLALAIDRDHGLPLFHRLYPANEHDSKVFSRLVSSLFSQISGMVNDKKGMTFVFDKGNNSEEAILMLDESRHHYIGSRSPYHHKDVCRRSLETYQTIELQNGDSVLAFESVAELYGKQRRIVITYNESNYKRQLYRLEKNIERAKAELSFFKKRAKGADGRSTLDSIDRNAREILERYHVNQYVGIDVEELDEGFKVSARQNFPAIEDAKTRFGKHILFTNRESLSMAEIIQYYRDRNIVEEAFKITKSDQWVKMDPAFHWTDSKIRVHALTCILALLLVKIAHKRAVARGFKHGVPRMMELLRGIKSAVLFYPQSTKPYRHLCSLSSDQNELLTILKISAQP